MDETDKDNLKFITEFEKDLKWYTDRGKKPDYYRILRNKVFLIFKWDFVFVVLLSIITECSSLSYSWVVGFVIKFIRNEDPA